MGTCVNKSASRDETSQTDISGPVVRDRADDPFRTNVRASPPRFSGVHAEPHHCTDVGCLVVFAGAVAFFVLMLAYVKSCGDLRRLYHGIDFYGDLCGIDAPVADKPLLYWCAAGTAGNATGTDGNRSLQAHHRDGNRSLALDLQHPICVATCPTGNDTNHSCVEKLEHFADKPADLRDFEVKTIFTFHDVPDYSTASLAGRYCRPTNLEELSELLPVLERQQQAVVFHASQVKDAWPVFLVAALLAFVLGYLYVCTLNCVPRGIIFGTLGLAALLPIATGVLLLYGSATAGSGELVARTLGRGVTLPSTGDGAYDLVAGALLVCVGLAAVAVAVWMRRSIMLTITGIEAACDCLMDVPVLFLQPFLTVLLRVGLLLLFAVGLLDVVSIGEVQHHSINGLSGVARTFAYSPMQRLSVFVYVVVGLWIQETMDAVQKFSLAYSAQSWFFQTYVRGRPMLACPLVQGILTGLVFHSGTLALGALIIPPCRLVRGLLKVISYANVGAGGDAQIPANKVVGCLGSCCFCCIIFWESLVKYLKTKAYIVVAIDSLPFFPATLKAFDILAHELEGTRGVFTANWIVSFWGVAALTSIVAWVAWALVRGDGYFASATSLHFVDSPELIAAVAAAIGFVAAVSFTRVHDTIADTVLFCWVIKLRDQTALDTYPDTKADQRLQAFIDRVESGQQGGWRELARIVT